MVRDTRDPRHIINKKSTAWKKAKRCNTEGSWSRYREHQNQVKAILKEKHNQYIASLGVICSSNPKKFWSVFRAKTRNCSIPAKVSDGSVECESPKDKATLFNNYFGSVFTNNAQSVCTLPEHDVNSIPLPFFRVEKVLRVLEQLNVNKACSSADISHFILKNCCFVLAASLACIFNMSVRCGQIPVQWKYANVVPIFKKGDRTFVSNYRAVSLLTCTSKVMERCLVDHLYPHVHPALHELQHGFMKQRSCTTQLLKVYHSIGKILDSGGQVDILYLDFSKAFDRVSHPLLLYKLEHLFGITGVLLDWFKSYLSGRFQRVTLEGQESVWLPVMHFRGASR